MFKKIFLATVVLPITTMILLSFFSTIAKAEEPPLFIYEKEIINQLGNDKLPQVETLEQIKTYQQKHIKIKVTDGKYLNNLLEKRAPDPSPKERTEEIIALRNSKRQDRKILKELDAYISNIREQNEEDLSKTYKNLIAKIEKYQVKKNNPSVARSLDEYISERSAVKPNEKVFSLIAEIPFYKANTIKAEMSPTTSSITLFTERILKTKQEEVFLNYRYKALLATIDESSVTTKTQPNEKEIIAQQPTTEPQASKIVSSNFEKKGSSNSTNVTFSVTILPVRFVYVENGQIVKIWNNTTENDTEYVLKFLDYESNEEIIQSEQLTLAYFDSIEDINVFEQGVIFEKAATTFVDNSKSSEVQFHYTSRGIEEVHTFI